MFNSNWILLVGGLGIFITGIYLFINTLSPKGIRSKSQLIFSLVAVVLGVSAIVMTIAHTNAENETINESILKVINDDQVKTIRAYFSVDQYMEYRDVVRVEFADDNVIAFVTKDGRKHAVRPGTNLVEVTEDVK